MAYNSDTHSMVVPTGMVPLDAITDCRFTWHLTTSRGHFCLGKCNGHIKFLKKVNTSFL